MFSVKYKSDEFVERYKTRKVAKGYRQTYGFALVAKMNTMRLLLSLATNFNWDLQ